MKVMHIVLPIAILLSVSLMGCATSQTGASTSEKNFPISATSGKAVASVQHRGARSDFIPQQHQSITTGMLRAPITDRWTFFGTLDSYTGCTDPQSRHDCSHAIVYFRTHVHKVTIEDGNLFLEGSIERDCGREVSVNAEGFMHSRRLPDHITTDCGQSYPSQFSVELKSGEQRAIALSHGAEISFTSTL